MFKNREDIKNIVNKILKRKEIPNNYTNEIKNILNKMSFNLDNLEILGSMSFRSMLYASDFDCFEIVDMSSINAIQKEFLKIIKTLLNDEKIYIGDIKIGHVDEWEVINEFEDYSDYNYEKTLKKLKNLKDKKIINMNEFKEALNYLKRDLSEIDFIKMKKQLRFHILRWTPKEILSGFKDFRGKKITFKEALQSKGLFKLDSICRLENKTLQEFSIIYEPRIKGIRINKQRVDFIKSIKEAIKYYKSKGNFFKVAKRLFSLYNYKLLYIKNNKKEEDEENIYKLFKILNSDLGILYMLHGDIDLMLYLLENNKEFKVKYLKTQTDDFIKQLSNVYSSSILIQKEPKLLELIQKILKTTNKKTLINLLTNLDDNVSKILNYEAEKELNNENLL